LRDRIRLNVCTEIGYERSRTVVVHLENAVRDVGMSVGATGAAKQVVEHPVDEGDIGNPADIAAGFRRRLC
jgi:hypothetical protein